jgi:hypothetical protein
MTRHCDFVGSKSAACGYSNTQLQVLLVVHWVAVTDLPYTHQVIQTAAWLPIRLWSLSVMDIVALLEIRTTGLGRCTKR